MPTIRKIPVGIRWLVVAAVGLSVVAMPAPAPGQDPTGGFADKKKELDRARAGAPAPSGPRPAAGASKVDRNAEPRIVPTPAPPDPKATEGKIEIKPGEVRRSKASNPESYWRSYYQKHDEDPAALREKIGILNAHRKFRDVEAVLKAYLKYRPEHTASWIYLALAIAIKENSGKDEEVKTSLNYAADLAVRSRNPNDLVLAADQMFLMGYNDRVGPLIDQAAEMVPHRDEPLIMSINLAQRVKDPNRMGASIEKLLSLGWPGADDAYRRDVRKQAEQLAKALKEDGRGDEAEKLLARLPDAEARDVFIRLTWVGEADLDLAVDEPLGATARFRTPRTVFGGSILKNGFLSHPEEVYVCPRGFDGEYVVRVESVYNNPEKPALTATLEIITHEGTPKEHKETHTLKLGAKPPEPVKFTLADGRRTSVLPFVAPTTVTPPPPPGRSPNTRREGVAKDAKAGDAAKTKK